LPDTYHTAGIRRDRHLNFYEARDNLLGGVSFNLVHDGHSLGGVSLNLVHDGRSLEASSLV
jgi:hypothetical protein